MDFVKIQKKEALFNFKIDHMFKYYNHLGFHNPYYYQEKGKFRIEKTFSGIVQRFNGSLIIDSVAVVELLNKGHMLADRTIVQDIYKTPWMAKPNNEFNKWIFAKIPKHGNLSFTEEEIATTLFEKICNEIELYIGDKKKIGVLLSGGMDSRIVAGALDYLIKNKNLQNIEVTALTWGNERTRDVVYSKEIAIRLGWIRKHYTVTLDDLMNNITETAIHGCEYSPIHLHAIPQIRDDNNDLDVILAGSYGDSIGRSEYSGKTVKYLKPLIQNIKNIGKFTYNSFYQNSLKQIEQDVEYYHSQFPENESYMQNEKDYQLHYMRRMLNPCMNLLAEKMKFYQIFTHPDVFGYMWSINPDRRNDLVYKNLLKLFKTNLDDIPWARTGLKFGEKNGTPDSYIRSHHNYPQLIYQILFDKINMSKTLSNLNHLGIINTKATKIWSKAIKKIPSSNLLFLDKLIWLVSLSEMCEIYNIKGYDKILKTKNHLMPISILFEYIKTNSIHSTKSYIKRKLNL